ncbi:MAG: glutathione S-transferase family protein [Sphaerospermopsis sp. SIO1G2]|nr:glutathione S-transferase family protein [Sphaerospermopsis sp. SIO1G2]
MITLYHLPLSPNSRRVWITLIEKGLDFQLVEVNLGGDQFKPEFLAMNPFHHIPTLVDDGFNVIESLAILDYLEAKYPTPVMLPKDAKDLAVVKMVELVSVNELLPALTPIMAVIFDLPKQDPEAIEKSKTKINTVLKFFADKLENRPYFGSDNITLADVVAGTIVPWLPQAGISLDEYPQLKTWCDRIIARPSWQTTQTTQEMIEKFKQLLMSRK